VLDDELLTPPHEEPGGHGVQAYAVLHPFLCSLPFLVLGLEPLESPPHGPEVPVDPAPGSLQEPSLGEWPGLETGQETLEALLQTFE